MFSRVQIPVREGFYREKQLIRYTLIVWVTKFTTENDMVLDNGSYNGPYGLKKIHQDVRPLLKLQLKNIEKDLFK